METLAPGGLVLQEKSLSILTVRKMKLKLGNSRRLNLPMQLWGTNLRSLRLGDASRMERSCETNGDCVPRSYCRSVRDRARRFGKLNFNSTVMSMPKLIMFARGIWVSGRMLVRAHRLSPIISWTEPRRPGMSKAEMSIDLIDLALRGIEEDY